MDLHKLKALSARLPTSIGSKYVLTRCLLLRKILAPFSYIAFPLILPDLLRRTTVDRDENIPLYQYNSPEMGIRGLFVLPFLIIEWVFAAHLAHYDKMNATLSGLWHMSLIQLLGGIYVLMFVTCFALYIFRSVGSKITIRYVSTQFRCIDPISVTKRCSIMIGAVFVAGGVLLGPGAVTNFVASMLGYTLPGIESYVFSFVVLTALFMLGRWLREFWRQRRQIARLRELRSTGSLGPQLFIQAYSISELKTWLDRDHSLLNNNLPQIRSLTRLLMSFPKYEENHPVFGGPLFKANSAPSGFVGVIRSLEKRLHDSAPPA